MPRCPDKELNFTISNKISLNFNSSQNLNLLYIKVGLDLYRHRECCMISMYSIYYSMNALWLVCAISTL